MKVLFWSNITAPFLSHRGKRSWTHRGAKESEIEIRVRAT